MVNISLRIWIILAFEIIIGIGNAEFSFANDGFFYDDKDYEIGKSLILEEEGGHGKRHFEIIGHLGKGAQGSVLLVEEITETRHARVKGETASHDHMYAMKIMKVTLGEEGDTGQHVEVEIKAMIDCQGPHVVKYYDHFKRDFSNAWNPGRDEKKSLEAIRKTNPEKFPATGRVYFILMEVLRNGSLKNLLAALKHSSKKMPMENVRFFAADITLGLGGVHVHSYIFHDLKPDNLLIDDRGHLKIADFGAARKIDAQGLYLHALGTCNYVAPDVTHAHGREVDWWSMGSVLFEMIYQHVIDPTSNTSHMLYHLLGIVEYMKTFALPVEPSVPAVEKKFLLGLLEKDPNERLGRENTAEGQKKGAAAVKADPFFADHGLRTEDEWKAHTQHPGPYHRCELANDPNDREKIVCYKAGVHGECNICDISRLAMDRHIEHNVKGFENGQRDVVHRKNSIDQTP